MVIIITTGRQILSTNFAARKSHILDLGCGKKVRRPVFCIKHFPLRSTGFDLDEALIEIAINKGGGPIYQQGNAKKLPFENDSFDLVFARLLLIMYPDVKMLSKKWCGFANSSGIVMVQDLVIPKNTDLYPENWAYEKINQAMRELFATPTWANNYPYFLKNHGLADILDQE
ncbi:MAG: methyltransferase domain-containing protein [Saprospiraceae bacterium]